MYFWVLEIAARDASPSTRCHFSRGALDVAADGVPISGSRNGMQTTRLQQLEAPLVERKTTMKTDEWRSYAPLSVIEAAAVVQATALAEARLASLNRIFVCHKHLLR